MEKKLNFLIINKNKKPINPAITLAGKYSFSKILILFLRKNPMNKNKDKIPKETIITPKI